MAKDKIFNIRVSEDDYVKLKQLGSIRAREILLDAVNDRLFEELPKSEMEKLIHKYDKLDTDLANLEQKVQTIDQKALSKLIDDAYAQPALSDFEDLYQRVDRSVANLNRERFELLKARRSGARYLYTGVRELAIKRGLNDLLDRPDPELYNELASKQLIDNKDKYKKSISELIRSIQDRIKGEEQLLNSLKAMSPYIIMKENIQSQIEALQEEMKDVLYVIEHIKALEKRYVRKFLESLKCSGENERSSAAKLLENEEFMERFYDSDLSLYEKFEKYLVCCGVDINRAKAIVKKHMT
jgi:predicted  nucleic acid-binding Zn-ribbon protein